MILPLHAQGYRRGFSASPGFLHIRHTSSSSSSSSSYLAVGEAAGAGAADDAVDSISFPFAARGDEAREEAEDEGEEEEDDDGGEFATVSAAIGLPSREGGGSCAISMADSNRTGLDRR